ncbi:MAG TPA: GAF domain-containing protein [Anaeromyxobacteraceae bacterium]|nr:GAF domain-containing protein [Anaeromyxobacteraceae bacterium]
MSAGPARGRLDRVAVWLPIAYVIVTAVWILVSDRVVVRLAPTPEAVAWWSTLKGWGFVLATGTALHVVLRRGAARDREAAARLAASEARYRALVEKSPDGCLIVQDERVVYANARAADLFGAAGPAALLRGVLDLVAPEDHRAVRERIERILGGRPFDQLALRTMRRLDGSSFRADVSVAPMEHGGRPALLVALRDVSDRELLEETLGRTNRALRTLLACNEALVRAREEHELLEAVCRAAVEPGGFRMAWVGFAEADVARSVRPVARAGHDEGYLDALRLTWADEDRGRGPIGVAIRTGQPAVTDDIAADLRFGPWRAQALRRGYASNLALPFERGGGRRGVLALYSAEPGAFDAEVVRLFRQLAEDLAYGLETLRSRQELRALASRLQVVREEETTRIARDLHDELGQVLTGLKMDLRWIERRLGDQPRSAEVSAVLERAVAANALSDRAVGAVQRIAAELRPGALDRLGLGAAVREAMRDLEARGGIACRVDVPDDLPEPPSEAATGLYRILQEALTNVVRHAGASNVEVALRASGGRFTLRVADDGRGMDPGAREGRGALGLLGMRERAMMLGGDVSFERGPGGGTVVTAVVPDRVVPRG